MHCPGIAILADHPRRPLSYYYCKSDLFIHTSLPVCPPPPVNFAAPLFILIHPLVSTCTSLFLLIFLSFILRGPGGRGHREHKCFYCPHPGTLPRVNHHLNPLLFWQRPLDLFEFTWFLSGRFNHLLFFAFILPAFLSRSLRSIPGTLFAFSLHQQLFFRLTESVLVPYIGN